MSWNVQGSMRGDGVPVAPGMLAGEAVAAGVMKAKGAIPGLFQETGLQDPQGVVHSENQWRQHGYHAYPGVDAQAASAAAVRGGLLIALRADVFAAEEVRDVVDIVPGKAMALNVVTAGGTLTVINVHGPGSGGDSWASKASFWADVAMYAAAKSAAGTRAVLLGGDFRFPQGRPGTGGGQEAHEGGAPTGLLPSELASRPMGGAWAPTLGAGAVSGVAGVGSWPCGLGPPAGGGRQREGHQDGLLARPRQAACHTPGLPGGS